MSEGSWLARIDKYYARVPIELKESGEMSEKYEYKIQIDKEIYSVNHHLLTGRELLDLAKSIACRTIRKLPKSF